ncbi:MAG: glycosyltransferase [Gemmatimonadota bacterium]|nr:MAG: glycosyltransferase [Gemmatimonadota bacterium]
MHEALIALNAGAALAGVPSVAYLLALALLVPFGAHRILLLWRLLWLPPRPVTREWVGPLPRVTVQLPVYNEANVVERLIDAACRLDYPKALLEIQLLDDSTDETGMIASRRVDLWRRRGCAIEHLRRPDRSGYKAGALAWGTSRSSGEFLLLLDADFLPRPGLVRQLLGPFADPRVGMVQAAWGYLNAGESWLTRAQALLLDAHFRIEHEARFRSGLFFNFNGTAGMWRRRCVESAGGWRAATLTEDLDLSYRAQLAGWRFVLLPDVEVPGELPPGMWEVDLQQDRWTRGGIQTARLLLPSVWRSSWRVAVKLEATAHLLGHLAHPATLFLALTLGAASLAGAAPGWVPAWWHAVGLAAATLPFLGFATAAALRRGVRWSRVPLRVLEALVMGIGLGAPLTWAAFRGTARKDTPFRRTPKRGLAVVRTYAIGLRRGPALFRALLGALLGASALAFLARGAVAPGVLSLLFAMGHLATLRESLRRPAVPGQEQKEGKVDRQAGEERLWPDARRLVGIQAPVGEKGGSAEENPGAAAA